VWLKSTCLASTRPWVWPSVLPKIKIKRKKSYFSSLCIEWWFAVLVSRLGWYLQNHSSQSKFWRRWPGGWQARTYVIWEPREDTWLETEVYREEVWDKAGFSCCILFCGLAVSANEVPFILLKPLGWISVICQQKSGIIPVSKEKQHSKWFKIL
jgi:hypothetical protein